jgi:hypothetical protein
VSREAGRVWRQAANYKTQPSNRVFSRTDKVYVDGTVVTQACGCFTFPHGNLPKGCQDPGEVFPPHLRHVAVSCTLEGPALLRSA